MTLKADAKAARAAADKSVKDRDPKEKQRELAARAVELEEQLKFEDAVAHWEGEGFTVTGDSFANIAAVEAEQGPDYDDKPGEVG
jgi:hypothetical protein